jgi:hypothetical protein
LSIDLADVINDQQFATASGFVTSTATSSSEVDVSSLSSTSPVFSLLSQALIAQGVYTLFVYDTATGLTTGRLKKER